MFAPQDRDHLRSLLLELSRRDPRISGAAITGSAAVDRQDQWSDIDLAFAVENPDTLPEVLSDWTDRLYREHRALHHLDIHTGEWIYRVFLLASTLQVDLAFVPAAEFRPLASTFQLVFGNAHEARTMPSPACGDLIGFGWLYALHARSCIARGKFWQAEYMVSGVRDNALALACVRHSLPAVHGKGLDLLPPEVTRNFSGALVRHLDAAELLRAFRVAVHGLLLEIESVDEPLAKRLQPALTRLTET